MHVLESADMSTAMDWSRLAVIYLPLTQKRGHHIIPLMCASYFSVTVSKPTAFTSYFSISSTKPLVRPVSLEVCPSLPQYNDHPASGRAWITHPTCHKPLGSLTGTLTKNRENDIKVFVVSPCMDIDDMKCRLKCWFIVQTITTISPQDDVIVLIRFRKSRLEINIDWKLTPRHALWDIFFWLLLYVTKHELACSKILSHVHKPCCKLWRSFVHAPKFV